jgi:hypothetical protein
MVRGSCAHSTKQRVQKSAYHQRKKQSGNQTAQQQHLCLANTAPSPCFVAPKRNTHAQFPGPLCHKVRQQLVEPRDAGYQGSLAGDFQQSRGNA